MVYCYFNDDVANTYGCEYEISDKELLIRVFFKTDSSKIFKKEDLNVCKKTITVIDNESKLYIKTFDAIKYQFLTNLDGITIRNIKSFKSQYYIKTEIPKNLQKLTSETKIDNLMFYHECLDSFFNNNSKHIEGRETNEIKITLIKGEDHEEDLKVKHDNIKSVAIVNEWSASIFNNDNEISVKYRNTLRLIFKKSINLFEIFKYKQLITCMFNIFYLSNTPIYKIKFKLDNVEYEFCSQNFLYKPTYKIDIGKLVSRNINIKKFIQSFLNKISIKDIETNKLNPFKEKGSYYVEDLFLKNFRFLEMCLKQKPKDSMRLENYLKNNLPLLKALDIKYDSELHLRIKALRNHYVHEGYYIKDNILIIKKKEKEMIVVNNETLIGYAILTKALAYKLMLSDILSLNIKDDDIAKAILRSF